MKEKILEKYDKCTTKEKIAIITAIAAFIFGWGLTIAGFIIPPTGQIADSVLWVLGQGLVYTASVFGVTTYFNAESIKLKYDMNQYFNNKMKYEFEKFKEQQEQEENK